MNNPAQNKYHSLMEAYYAVYDEDIRNKLNEEKQIKEFLEVIDFLIEDGYDLSEYTYEELYEFHINERWGGLLKGIMKGAAGAVYKGAKGPAKKVLTKLGQLAVPTAIAAGLDQYFTGGKGREYGVSAIQGLRQMGHSLPTPGQAADAFKAPETPPETAKPFPPRPPRRNLPPAHLTQSYSYRKNNIITEDPAFPSQKPKGGDWSKLTIGGITKFWDPETNSYQLPGTINKRLKSQGEKEITVPGKAPTPTSTSTSSPAPSPAPSPSPASSPAPSPSPASSPAPSRLSSSVTASTADKIKGGMDIYNKQRSSGDFKAADETGKSIWALKNPGLAAAAAEKARIRGTQQTDNPLMKDMRSRLPMNSPSVQSPDVANLGAGNQSLSQNPNSFKAAPKPTPTPARSGFGVSGAQLAAKSSVATATAAPTPAATPSVGQKAARLSLGSSQFKPAAAPKDPPPPKKETSPPPPKTPISSSYEYDAYDLVLEYLLSQGHTDTIEEANYVMLEMDSEMIQSICEAEVDKRYPEHERSGIRLARYDNPSGALALGGGQQRARREEHEKRRGKKKVK